LQYRPIDRQLKQQLLPGISNVDAPDGLMDLVTKRSLPSGATSKRRVALVFCGFSGGGIERSTLRLTNALIERGLGVDLVVQRASGPLLPEVPQQASVVQPRDAPWWRERMCTLAAEPAAWGLVLRRKTGPLSRLGCLDQLPRLAQDFKRARPDAILAIEAPFNLMAVWARRLARLGSRIVVSERIQVSRHGSLSPWGDRQASALLRRAYLSADGIVAVSDGAADDLATYADIPRDRITTVYNPVVGPELIAKTREPLDHPWFAAGEPPLILSAGRLDPQKDYATLIRAFARVRARRPARLMILGAAAAESDYAAGLKALTGQLGVDHDVAMPGFVQNPLAYMSRAAVFVLSSAYEGLGNVLIEALACGTPAVSTDCPSGPREILDHGRFGTLVPVGDDAALAHSIEQALDDPPPSERLRARAELFSVDRAADNYLRLLFPADDAIELQG
jgi:glycosyltransferase involved in cell wall biosynthesis